MVFKDRRDAGRKLASKLTHFDDAIIVSLLRGGVIVGDEIAKKLRILHLPLIVSKISAPHNEELAIGALCFDIVYLDPSIVKVLGLAKRQITTQIAAARAKFESYQHRFDIRSTMYKKVKGQTVLLVDDGIATGATARAALLFIKSYKPRKVVLATPVVSPKFDIRGFNQLVTFPGNREFSSVSQFFQHFQQVEDKEVEQILHLQAKED